MERSGSLGSVEGVRDGARSPRSPRPLSPPVLRDHSPSGISSACWTLQGASYAEQWPGAVGAPGQDLHRLMEGPSLYLNGPPNAGSKSTLQRDVYTSPRGGIKHGVNSGPGQMTQVVMDRKVRTDPCARGAGARCGLPSHPTHLRAALPHPPAPPALV